jgi:hypothetical protein
VLRHLLRVESAQQPPFVQPVDRIPHGLPAFM